MYTVKVKTRFTDLENNGIIRKEGDIFDISTEERLRTLCGENKRKTKFVELVRATKPMKTTDTSSKIIIFQDYLYYIGGIETFLYNLAKNYSYKDITIICRQMEIEQFINLSKYANVEVMNPTGKYECDTLILGNYNCDYFIPKCKANKIYQMIHADWRGLRMTPEWSNFKWKSHSKVDEIICVSDSAKEGLKETMDEDSKVIYNILDEDGEKDDPMIFLTMSRASVDKGIYRVIQMAKAFKEAGKKFKWILSCSLEQVHNKEITDAIKNMDEFIVIEPTTHNKWLYKCADYLVQLSNAESFCYSAYEALQRNIPLILTNFPEAKNIVDDGENGYLVELDLSNLDVDKIFNHKPTNMYYVDRCNKDDWEKVFKGEF